MAAIGIDLGTTNSCVAVWRNGQVDVIPNNYGSRKTPSVVSFTSSARFIGEEARNQIPFNPFNTVFGVKRLLGRRFDDVEVQMELRHLPFTVANYDNRVAIIVEHKGERKKCTPEEICAMIIYRMKNFAENHLKTKVDKVVIAVPAYFNDNQRQATKKAASIAGLEVLWIVNEPTAAALAYGLTGSLEGKTNVCVFDLGGGTLDVSVLTVRKGSVYEVKAMASNIRLGGNNFDSRLVAYFVEDFRKKFNTDISTNAKALRRLKISAENAKKVLTSALEVTVEIQCLCDGLDYRVKISRELFNELCSDLFEDTLRPIRQALKAATMSKDDIHSVILTGGSSKIPKIRTILVEMFDGRVLTSLNPDEAVVSGAAIQAAVLSGQNHKKLQDLFVMNVVPLSLGIEIGRGIMFKVIERNTPIPCRQTKDITTLDDNQSCMTIEIFEGERSLTKDNNPLGAIELNGIPLGPRGVAKIDVTFDIDINGTLNVYAKEPLTGNMQAIKIDDEYRLNHKAVEKMIADANAFEEEDKENKLRLEARNQLETYVFGVNQTVDEKGEKLSDEERDIMLKECREAKAWLDDNTDCLTEEFEMKMTECMKRWFTIMTKLNDNCWRNRFKRLRTENLLQLLEHESTHEEVEGEEHSSRLRNDIFI